MGKRERYCAELARYFHDLSTTDRPIPLEALPLTAFLLENSNLPGPRGNLELAYAFGDVVDSFAYEHASRLWALCSDLVALSPDEAPGDAPGVFLPFCGTVGMGALGAAVARYTWDSLARLRELARDPRWRVREGVCFGLQRLLGTQATAVFAAFSSWVVGGDPLEMRAAAAAVADPPLLAGAEIAAQALALHREILDVVIRWSTEARHEDGFAVLRQGLSFTLSVVVSALPDEGFAFMRELATEDDRDVARILRENLKKKRLSGRYTDRVEEVQALLRVPRE